MVDNDIIKYVKILDLIFYFYLNDIVCTTTLVKNQAAIDEDNLNVSYLVDDDVPKFEYTEKIVKELDSM